MRLRPTEEERAFRDSVRGTVRDVVCKLADGADLRSDGTALAAIDDLQLWHVAQEAGWLELAAPESLRENLPFAAVLMEELGRASLATPVSETIAANALLALVGLTDTGAAQASRTLALPDCRRIDDLPIWEGRPAAPVVNARPLLVGWGDAADVVLLPIAVRTSERINLGLAAIGSGVERTAVPREQVLDHDRLAILTPSKASDLELVWEAEPGGEAALWQGFSLARLLRAWELLGNARTAMRLTAQHVAQREQFGRTLASMQAVQLHLADMWLALEAAELLAAEATDLAAGGGPFAVTADCATFAAGRAAEQVTQMAIHLHGGVGYMWEYDLHWHYRRVKALRMRLGTRAQQLQAIATAKLAEITALPYPSWPRKGAYQ